LFRLHAFLILTLLVSGSAVATVRSERPPIAVLTTTLRGASSSAAEGGLSPLSAPPSPPVALDGALQALGYDIPDGANVYAVRVVDGPEGRIYEQYQAGGGPLATNFWPASSIKVLAALGALDYLKSLGYTGAATVTFDGDGPSQTVRSIYEPAIRVSDNYDYDLLVQIAGRDWLNDEFLTARNGFPVTSLSRSYTGLEFDESPGMTFSEGGRQTHVPPRKAQHEPECKTGNCSNLFEMTESVRRIVLNDELPPEQRFDLAPADLKDLTASLLAADGFFDDAVAATLGPGAKIYSKPGDADGLDCLDVTFIQSRAGKRYLLAATVPHRSGGCDALSQLARGVLQLLSA
jgi:hypothetical protein